MDQRLREFEARRIAARSSAPDLQQAVWDAYRRLELVASPPFEAANARIITLLSDDEAVVEFEYHNRHHVQDVIDAAALLLSANSNGHMTAQESEAFLTAALGHDLHHDGRGPLPEPVLERRSAKSVTDIGRDTGIPESSLFLIEALIIATHPALQKSLREREDLATSNGNADRLKLILGDADVLASLTPGLGQELSRRLAREWAASGVDVLPSPSSPMGRRQFLSAYRRLSAEAVTLGADSMIAEQLKLCSGDWA